VAGVATGSSNLRVSYKGYCSATSSATAVSCNQILAIWNWRTSSWLQLDSRVVTSETSISNVVVTPPAGSRNSDYIGTGSSAGQIRLRVFDYRPQTGGAAFTSRGNFMKVLYDTP
jgi:hypothetical protein